MQYLRKIAPTPILAIFAPDEGLNPHGCQIDFAAKTGGFYFFLFFAALFYENNYHEKKKKVQMFTKNFNLNTYKI